MTVNAAKMQFNSNTAAVELIIFPGLQQTLYCIKNAPPESEPQKRFQNEERRRLRLRMERHLDITECNNALQCTSRSQYNHKRFF